MKCDYVGCKNEASYIQTTTSPLPDRKHRIQNTHICEYHATNPLVVKSLLQFAVSAMAAR